MGNIVENEIRMRCVEAAVVVSGRQQNNQPEAIIAIAKELCDYVINGSSPTVSTSGEADLKINSPQSAKPKRTANKSG